MPYLVRRKRVAGVGSPARLIESEGIEYSDIFLQIGWLKCPICAIAANEIY